MDDLDLDFYIRLTTANFSVEGKTPDSEDRLIVYDNASAIIGEMYLMTDAFT